MPTTNLTISDQLLSTTAFALHDEIVDALDINRPLLANIDKMGKREQQGGERMIVSWRFNRHSQTTQLSTGYEPVNMTVQPVGTPGWEGWMDCIRPVVISGHEERLNRGEAEIVSILESRLQDTEQGFRAEFEEQLLFGNVPSMSDSVTLNGVVDTTGLLENRAVGAQTNTIHHVSRALHAGAPGFQNQYGDVGNAAANHLPTLYEIITRINRLAGVAGTSRNSIRGYQSVEACKNMKDLLIAQERYLTESELDGGKLVQFYNGIPLEVTDLPNQTNYSAMGTTDVSYIFLDHAQIQWVGQSGFYFKLSEFQSQPGYDTKAAFMHHMGQLVGRYFGTSALVVNADY